MLVDMSGPTVQLFITPDCLATAKCGRFASEENKGQNEETEIRAEAL